MESRYEGPGASGYLTRELPRVVVTFTDIKYGRYLEPNPGTVGIK